MKILRASKAFRPRTAPRECKANESPVPPRGAGETRGRTSEMVGENQRLEPAVRAAAWRWPGLEGAPLTQGGCLTLLRSIVQQTGDLLILCAEPP